MCLHRSWANLGAVVLILYLAVDPFMQAAVTVSGRMATVESPSQTPGLRFGDSVDIGQLVEEPKGGPIQSEFNLDGTPSSEFFSEQMDFGLTGAIYDGFRRAARDIPLHPQVSFSCSTGNCTWPVFTTAGVCSACNDVTSSLKRTRSPLCNADNGTDQALPSNVDFDQPCTTFSGLYNRIRQIDGLSDGDVNNKATSATVFLTANTTEDHSQTSSFGDTDTMFLSLLVLRASNEFASRKTAWEDSKPTATECGLFFCAKAFESRVDNGALVEKEVGSWAVRDPESWKMTKATDDDQEFADAHTSLERMPYYRTDLVIEVPSDEAEDLGRSVTTRFNITQATIAGLQKVLSSVLFDGSDGEDGDVPSEDDGPPIVFPAYNSVSGDYPLGKTLWDSKNLTAVFDTLANRLTIEFRDSSTAAHSGTVRLYTPHIEILWPYLALPLSGLLMGCLYFIIVWRQTHALGLPAWKESVYPALSRGFNDEGQALLRQLGNAPKYVQKKSGDLVIGLADSSDGLRLEVVGSDTVSMSEEGHKDQPRPQIAPLS